MLPLVAVIAVRPRAAATAQPLRAAATLHPAYRLAVVRTYLPRVALPLLLPADKHPTHRRITRTAAHVARVRIRQEIAREIRIHRETAARVVPIREVAHAAPIRAAAVSPAAEVVTPAEVVAEAAVSRPDDKKKSLRLYT